MKKKFTEISGQDVHLKKKGNFTTRQITDSEIDYSNIPEFSDSKLKMSAKEKGIGYHSMSIEILKKAV